MLIFIVYSLGVLYAGAYWNKPIMGFHSRVYRSIKAAFETYQG